MRKAIYPGSFDPVTNGHMDIIKRASKLFDKLFVAVLVNTSKKPMFSVEDRVDFLKRSAENVPNVEIISFKGLLVDLARECSACAIVKGLRAISDFEYEFQMSLVNQKLNPEVDTVFLNTSAENMFLSSSLIKEIGSLGGDFAQFLPNEIQDDVKRRILT